MVIFLSSNRVHKRNLLYKHLPMQINYELTCAELKNHFLHPPTDNKMCKEKKKKKKGGKKTGTEINEQMCYSLQIQYESSKLNLSQ